MKKFTIQICLLGYQRYLDKIEKLQNYSSNLKNCFFTKLLILQKKDLFYRDCEKKSVNKILL